MARCCSSAEVPSCKARLLHYKSKTINSRCATHIVQRPHHIHHTFQVHEGQVTQQRPLVRCSLQVTRMQFSLVITV